MFLEDSEVLLFDVTVGRQNNPGETAYEPAIWLALLPPRFLQSATPERRTIPGSSGSRWLEKPEEPYGRHCSMPGWVAVTWRRSLTLQQRGVIERLRERGHLALADVAHEAWSKGEHLPLGEPLSGAPENLITDLGKANAQASAPTD